MVEEVDDVCIRLDTKQSVMDGQTDRFAITVLCSACISMLTCVKTSSSYFFNNSLRHQPILIRFGVQHPKETGCK